MSYITHCHDIDYYVYPMIPYSEQKNYISTYKKRGNQNSSLIPHVQALVLPIFRG